MGGKVPWAIPAIAPGRHPERSSARCRHSLDLTARPKNSPESSAMCFSSSADAAKTIRLATKATAKATAIGRLIASPRRLRPRYSPTVPPSRRNSPRHPHPHARPQRPLRLASPRQTAASTVSSSNHSSAGQTASAAVAELSPVRLIRVTYVTNEARRKHRRDAPGDTSSEIAGVFPLNPP